MIGTGLGTKNSVYLCYGKYQGWLLFFGNSSDSGLGVPVVASCYVTVC